MEKNSQKKSRRQKRQSAKARKTQSKLAQVSSSPLLLLNDSHDKHSQSEFHLPNSTIPSPIPTLNPIHAEILDFEKISLTQRFSAHTKSYKIENDIPSPLVTPQQKPLVLNSSIPQVHINRNKRSQSEGHEKPGKPGKTGKLQPLLNNKLLTKDNLGLDRKTSLFMMEHRNNSALSGNIQVETLPQSKHSNNVTKEISRKNRSVSEALL